MAGYNTILDIQFNETSVTEPVTLVEVKDFCKIDISTDDSLLTALITSARLMCEDYTAIGFVRHEAVAVLNNPNGGIYLPYGPLIEIIQVTDEDGNILVLDEDYTVSGNSFVRLLTPTYDNITVSYTTGYETLPNALKTALLNTVYYLYDNRAMTIERIYDKNVSSIGNIGPIAEMILKPHRRV